MPVHPCGPVLNPTTAATGAHSSHLQFTISHTYCYIQQWYESPLGLKMFWVIVIQISHPQNITLQIAQQVTTQTTMETHQFYQHNTTVPLCCVSKYGNKMALTLLTTVALKCKMVKKKLNCKQNRQGTHQDCKATVRLWISSNNASANGHTRKIICQSCMAGYTDCCHTNMLFWSAAITRHSIL